MNRRIWIAGGLVLVAAAGAVLVLLLGRGQEQPATIVEVVNQVDAHPRPEDDWQPAVVDMAVYGGGQVRTGVESWARLELLEGMVRLSADSIFTVKKSAMRQGRPVTTLFLQEGRLWAHLAPGQPHEFNVETGSAVAAVRDTDFSVRVADGETLVSVAEGEVTLTAQEQSVTVAALQQTTVEPGQPPAPPEPMSDEERALWATEGEMPEIAPPVEMYVDVWCGLSGPAGDPASRHPETILNAQLANRRVAQVSVEYPDGEAVTLPSYGDVYGEELRFYGHIQELPQAGGTYTFTALDADGVPIPGAVASDVYVGGHEPDPPANIRAEVIEDGVLVTWDPSPVIPGAFDPGGSPPRGFYQMSLGGEEGMPFGWNSVEMQLPETSHLIPLRREDFGPGDRGLALEEMDDGVYYLGVSAFSVAPDGTAGRVLECEVQDPAEEIQIVIEGGQIRVEEP
jgi:hypothetical protein